jgi:glycerol-3-phosphate dehydrogenase
VQYDTCENADGRICFAIRFKTNYTLIVTTDEGYNGDPQGPAITPAETLYQLEAVIEHFRRPIAHDMIKCLYSGVRPLYDNGVS